MEGNIWVYLAALKRRFWVILLLLAATMAVVLGRAATTPPAYRSSAVLQVLPLEPEEVTLYTRQNAVSSTDAIDLIVFQFGNLLRSARMAQRTLSDTGIGMTTGDFADGISVERDPAGDLMTVSVTAGSPENAETLLERHIALSLEEFRASRALPSEASGKFLETQLAQAEQDLESARGAVLQFKLDNRMESLDREVAAEEQGIRGLTGAQQAALIEVKRLEAIIATLEDQLKAAHAASAAAEKDTPAADAANAAVVDLQKQLAAQRVQLASERAAADAVAPLLTEREGNLSALITLGGQYQSLQDAEKERLETRDFLAAKVREARLKESQSRSIGYLQVVSEPTTPRSQLPTQTVRAALLGALLAVVAGIVLVFILESIERSLRHSRGPAASGRGQQA
jgi:uncharacterized protein involved in exopolysaccharide biosynthesis